MKFLMIFGAAMAVIGLFLLIYWMWKVLVARKSGMDDNALNAVLQRAVIWNLVAMGISGLGLLTLTVGLLLA